ncbi:MAG TPA: amino acid permease [Terriglobia bacterium]|nr:amino acid permease [Terriglobia bacterium]
MASQYFCTKSIDKLLSDAEEPEHRLRKTLGPWSMTALGIGAIIGAGIFVLTGTAAAGEKLEVHSLLKVPLLSVLLHGEHAIGTAGRPGAGPAIALSFFLVAIACGLAGLCYAELASMIPIAGSAYTYTYATLGELVAWIIGWDLILEYAVSNMAVAVGYSAYFDSLLQNFGLKLPDRLSRPMLNSSLHFTGSYFNVPGFVVVMILTVILVVGIRESAGANNFMVGVKITAILIFIIWASGHVHPSNWKPFMPNGFQGVLTGGAIVFFTYIGFDSVSTAAEECRNPQKDVPFGIVASLIVCTILYCTVAIVLTGIQNWQTLRNAAPVANALAAIGLRGVERWVTIGALTGMLSSLLVFQLGQARVWFAMSRDGLLPRMFSKVHKRFRTPHISTWTAGLFVAIPAGIFDIGTLADLSNIGTLFAFLLVSLGVLVLRRTQPKRRRTFRVPWVPVIPLASVACCLILMASLPVETWLRFLVWLLIGLSIYFTYSRYHSEFAPENSKETGRERAARTHLSQT